MHEEENNKFNQLLKEYSTIGNSLKIKLKEMEKRAFPFNDVPYKKMIELPKDAQIIRIKNVDALFPLKPIKSMQMEMEMNTLLMEMHTLLLVELNDLKKGI